MKKLVLCLFVVSLIAGCKQHIARPKDKQDVSPKQVEEAAATFTSEQDFLKRAAQEVRGEIALAQLAQSKAESANVKAFAEQIVKDKTALASDLERLASAQK